MRQAQHTQRYKQSRKFIVIIFANIDDIILRLISYEESPVRGLLPGKLITK